MSKILVLVMGLSLFGTPARAVRCGDVLPVPWPWEALSSESDQKRVYINWVHDISSSAQNSVELSAAKKRIQKQTESFIAKLLIQEPWNSSLPTTLSKSDLDYLYQFPKRILRAADPDRIHVDVKKQYFRMIDSQSIEEARAMEIAEIKKLAPAPVSRSYRHGADMVDGSGIHYSLKQVASHFNDQKDRTKQSFNRALETLEFLGQQQWPSSIQTTHLALDMRHLENSYLAEDMRAYLLLRLNKINSIRSDSELPAIRLVFIY